MASQSGMSISAVKRKNTAINFTCQSSMTITGNLKWNPETDTSETWTAIDDSSEIWTPIADNSESWQIAA
jgi:hypothetical protein